MGYGMMKVSVQDLVRVLHLPEDYKAISVQQDPGYGDTLTIWLASPSIPEQPKDEYPLEIAPRYTLSLNPECPHQEYRKFTCEVEIRHRKQLLHSGVDLTLLLDDSNHNQTV